MGPRHRGVIYQILTPATPGADASASGVRAFSTLSEIVRGYKIYLKLLITAIKRLLDREGEAQGQQLKLLGNDKFPRVCPMVVVLEIHLGLVSRSHGPAPRQHIRCRKEHLQKVLRRGAVFLGDRFVVLE